MTEFKFFKKRGRGKRKHTQPHDIELKLKIIQEYQSGHITFRMLSKKYNINQSLISYWVRRFEGRVNQPKSHSIKKIVLNQEEKKGQCQDVAALKKALEETLLKNKALETMIDIAEQELKVNIRKKSGTKRSQ